MSYHQVKEAIAAGIILFTHIPGNNITADILINFEFNCL